MSQPSVAIVGAGITGLVTALRLRARGFDVRVFEAADRVGGPIQSHERDGYRLERGPHTILEKNLETARLIRELGLDTEVVEANDQASKRFVVRDGTLHPIPMSPGQFLATDLLSDSAKLRLFLEPFVPARNDDHIDESLANFVRRRLGDEVLEYAVGPFVGGIFAGRPRLLSARHAFERMHRLEREHGSLLGGMLHRLLSRIGDDDSRPKRRLISFRNGSHQLIDGLQRRLESEVVCQFDVRGLRDDRQGGWHLESEDGRTEGPFDLAIWTAPSHALQRLELVDGEGTRADLELFGEVEYPPVAVVATGWERYRVGHPLDGFGFLMPEHEPYRILGTLFMSTLFPNRAPAGRALMSSFVGGSRSPQLCDLSDRKLVDLVRDDLQELVDTKGSPEMVDICRWERAIPQYEVGYGRILDRLRDLEIAHDGLHFAGSFRNGIAVPDLIAAADDLASTLVEQHAGRPAA